VRVTLLGHTTVLIEAAGGNVLIDPVFADPFGEGAIVSCPSRVVHRERLPRLDLIVVSSGNPDRFDVASLSQLPRDRLVLCPKHPMVVYGLEKLGFTKVRPSDPNLLAKFAKYEVLTTPTARQEAEFGIVVKDAGGTVWHQGNTTLTPPMIEHVRGVAGRTHLLLAPFATQSFDYFGTQRAGFPREEIRARTATIRQISPAVVVPWSAGFRFAAPFEWINTFVFPISRRRFLHELSAALPQQKVSVGNPGDVFELAKGAVKHIEGASRVARMLRDDSDLVAFDPTAAVPPLTDPNLESYPDDAIRAQVAETLDEVARFVVEEEGRVEPLLDEHRRLQNVYGLGVVFPDGSEQWLRIDFRGPKALVERGNGPVRLALTVHRIAASVVTARARYERTYHFTGGLSRLSLISPAALVRDEVVIRPSEPHDLLLYVLTRKAGGLESQLKRLLDVQLTPFLSGSK